MSSDYLTYRRQLKNGEIPTPDKKPRKKIKPFSDKRSKLNRQYAKESKPFWKGKDCEIRLPGCTGKAQCINHKKGKATPALLMNKEHWEAACFFCNNEIENQHKWAVENDHKRSRLNKQ